MQTMSLRKFAREGPTVEVPTLLTSESNVIGTFYPLGSEPQVTMIPGRETAVTSGHELLGEPYNLRSDSQLARASRSPLSREYTPAEQAEMLKSMERKGR